jgi:hypothetical protein
MIRVHLAVLPAGSELEDDRGDDWGEWDFVSLPRAGDHIDIDLNDRVEILTVRRVIHFAAQHPLPRSEAPYRQRREPSIRIIAAKVAGADV